MVHIEKARNVGNFRSDGSDLEFDPYSELCGFRRNCSYDRPSSLPLAEVILYVLRGRVIPGPFVQFQRLLVFPFLTLKRY